MTIVEDYLNFYRQRIFNNSVKRDQHLYHVKKNTRASFSINPVDLGIVKENVIKNIMSKKNFSEGNVLGFCAPRNMQNILPVLTQLIFPQFSIFSHHMRTCVKNTQKEKFLLVRRLKHVLKHFHLNIKIYIDYQSEVIKQKLFINTY